MKISYFPFEARLVRMQDYLLNPPGRDLEPS